MHNNWYLEEKVQQYRHQEMLKAAELRRLINNGKMERSTPFYVRMLSKLGDNLVKTGFWLQDRYSNGLDLRNFEFDDPCLE
jgi:hypothetical protein